MGVILLDVDGVCADFVGMVRRLVEAEGGTLPEVTTWNFIRELPTPVRRPVETKLETATTWDFMDPIPGAAEAVDAFLEAEHRVVFVTSPWSSCREWAHARTAWLRRHMGVYAKDVIITQDKSLVRGDVFIDDKPENAAAWWSPGIASGLLWDAPYNQGHPMLPRLVGGWTQENIQRVLDLAHP